MTPVTGVGVYISRVEEGSVAERAGLRPGDSILEVNGTPFTGISHEEALKVTCYMFFVKKCFGFIFCLEPLQMEQFNDV